jgi:hypothetical protein
VRLSGAGAQAVQDGRGREWAGFFFFYFKKRLELWNGLMLWKLPKWASSCREGDGPAEDLGHAGEWADHPTGA